MKEDINYRYPLYRNESIKRELKELRAKVEKIKDAHKAHVAKIEEKFVKRMAFLGKE